RRIRMKNSGVLIADPTARALDTIAGSSTSSGFSGDGDQAVVAMLSYPIAVWTDANDNVLISDTSNNRVRQVSGGIINTIIGSGNSGYAGDGGPARGVTITATESTPGVTYLPAVNSVQMLQ